jgi:hypothetical protein
MKITALEKNYKVVTVYKGKFIATYQTLNQELIYHVIEQEPNDKPKVSVVGLSDVSSANVFDHIRNTLGGAKEFIDREILYSKYLESSKNNTYKIERIENQATVISLSIDCNDFESDSNLTIILDKLNNKSTTTTAIDDSVFEKHVIHHASEVMLLQ